MVDATGASAPHQGQEQDDQLDQELPPNPESLGPGQQEGQQLEVPADKNKMQRNVPPKIIERMECNHLLKGLGFSLVTSQAMVLNHGYNTAKKLSRLKPNDIDILIKTLCSPGGEHQDGTKESGISVPHSAQHALTSMCFVLFH